VNEYESNIENIQLFLSAYMLTLLYIQAVGASIRIFELLDKTPAISNQGGMKLDNLQGGRRLLDLYKSGLLFE